MPANGWNFTIPMYTDPKGCLKKSVVVFSGLGADERVFCNIRLESFDVTFLQWESPIKNERLEHYAARLTDQIKTSKPVLIGLSFGGIVALEVAKLIEVEKVILISSIQSPAELPILYKWSGCLKLHKIVPSWALKWPNFIGYWFFGAHSKADKHLLKSVLNDTDPRFLKWAIEQVLFWKSEWISSNIYHIHGDKDRILPLLDKKYTAVIRGGGHLMVYNKAEELNNKLMKILKGVENEENKTKF